MKMGSHRVSKEKKKRFENEERESRRYPSFQEVLFGHISLILLMNTEEVCCWQ